MIFGAFIVHLNVNHDLVYKIVQEADFATKWKQSQEKVRSLWAYQMSLKQCAYIAQQTVSAVWNSLLAVIAFETVLAVDQVNKPWYDGS